MSNQKTT